MTVGTVRRAGEALPSLPVADDELARTLFEAMALTDAATMPAVVSVVALAAPAGVKAAT